MKNTSEKSILIEKWLGSSRDKAAVRTVCSHISNMSKVSIKKVRNQISGGHLSYTWVSSF